ncbi:MAG: hypothetical protein RSA08_02845 [Clostridia bacterium]
MLYKEKFLNYLSLILAVITIILAMYSYVTKRSIFPSGILLILTLTISSISRYMNDKSINLNKKDMENLENEFNNRGEK